MENLNLTLIQTELAWENPPKNRAHFSDKIASIKGNTDLILLPEMFTTGFSMEPENLAENPNGKTLEWMQTHAKNKDAAISGSLIIKENGHYYNRLYFVYPDGSFQYYDKHQLFTYAGEHQSYSPGHKKLILNYKGWKICPLICYDLRFPVWARNTEDYDLLFYIANFPQSRVSSWDTLLKARSIENVCYTAGLNRIGTDANENAYSGHSAVYAPLGEPLHSPNRETEFIDTVMLSKNTLKNTRHKFPFLNDRDDFTIQH